MSQDSGSDPDPDPASTPSESTSTELKPMEPTPLAGAADLDRVLQQHEFVLVAFTADWCGPCQQMKPALAAIASETDTVVVTADVDDCESVASDHAVRQLPTQLVFVDGELVEQLVGAQTETRLRRVIVSVRQ